MDRHAPTLLYGLLCGDACRAYRLQRHAGAFAAVERLRHAPLPVCLPPLRLLRRLELRTGKEPGRKSLTLFVAPRKRTTPANNFSFGPSPTAVRPGAGHGGIAPGGVPFGQEPVGCPGPGVEAAALLPRRFASSRSAGGRDSRPRTVFDFRAMGHIERGRSGCQRIWFQRQARRLQECARPLWRR